jgi:hypothetical protein
LKFAAFFLSLSVSLSAWAGRCEMIFANDQPVLLAPLFLSVHPLSSKVKTLIDRANSFHSDGTVSRKTAITLIGEISAAVLSTEPMPELSTARLKEFKEKLIEDLKDARFKMNQNDRFDFFKLFEMARRASFIFETTETSFQAFAAIYSRKNTSPELSLSLRKTYLRSLKDRKPYSPKKAAADIQSLKKALSENPTAKPVLTFREVDELDIYQLLRHRTFILGVTTTPKFVDGNIFRSEEFLTHDLAHILQFLNGVSDGAGAIFSPANETTGDYDREIAWTELEQKLARLEDRLTRLEMEGTFKSRRILFKFFFNAYHEAFESLYVRLLRRPENYLSLEESILDEIEEYGRGTNPSRMVAEDLKIILEEARKILIPQ